MTPEERLDLMKREVRYELFKIHVGSGMGCEKCEFDSSSIWQGCEVLDDKTIDRIINIVLPPFQPDSMPAKEEV